MKWYLISLIFFYSQLQAEKIILKDPEQAPIEIRKEVMQGFNLMQQTQIFASDYVGDKITCNNCHFDGGNSLGGPNNGIPLVGVTHHYPRYSERSKQKITLKDRINNCFERSLNGKQLPQDSPQMNAIVAYLTWISKDVEKNSSLSWLGLKEIQGERPADANFGKVLYEEKCSGCHNTLGQGRKVDDQMIPPLAGDESFNNGAGMATISMLSSFIYSNMPYGEPSLTKQQAIDIAAYLLSLPRPKLK